MSNTNIAATAEYKLTDEVKAKITKWCARFPADKKRSGIMQALTLVQQENSGWLSVAAMDAVAEFLEVPKIAVYEIATFYSMYELKPVGKHKICVCTNVSCMLCGSEKIVQYLQTKLGVSFGETTKDGKFTLKEVECLAACGGAPAMLIGNQYFENLTPEKIDAILAKLE